MSCEPPPVQSPPVAWLCQHRTELQWRWVPRTLRSYFGTGMGSRHGPTMQRTLCSNYVTGMGPRRGPTMQGTLCSNYVTGMGPRTGPTTQQVLWIMTPSVWKSLCSLWGLRCPKWCCSDLRSSGMWSQSWCFEGTHHLPLRPVHDWRWGLYVPV